MVFDITQLKKVRKQLNLTQHQFAQKAGISQSLIAKIESGKLDPTYSKVKKIEQALELLTKHHEKQAKDIMNKNIISISPKENSEKIVNIMSKHSISQVPVIDKEIIIGLISESTLLRKDIKNKTAEEIMDESPPIIGKDASIQVIKQLLQFYPLVIIKEKGKLTGLITKADLIKNFKLVKFIW